MVRFFLVPVVWAPDGSSRRGPKYFDWPHGPAGLFPGAIWEGRDYGNEPTMVVAADLSAADATTLSAQSDVVTFAANLDSTLGASAATFQASLDALNIPVPTITGGTTYRQVLRGLTGVFLIAQCAQGKGVTIFGPTVTTATTFGALPQASQDAFTSCAPALGYSLAGLTASTTIKQLYIGIAQQASPSPMLGVTI